MATADYAREYRARPATKLEMELQEQRHKREMERLESELRSYKAWPLRDGYAAAKLGRAFDATQPADWQRGYHLALGTKKTADRHSNGRKAKR